MRLFEAKDLTKKYDKTVLNHLDFSIDEGEVVGIIGVLFLFLWFFHHLKQEPDGKTY